MLFTDAATVPAMRILTRILIGALALFNARRRVSPARAVNGLA
jgi:hypothetical protein